MNSPTKLNFPPYRFRVTCSGTDQNTDQMRIWDELRRRWLVLTPEEWVRQHLIRFLIEHRNVAPKLISQEYPVTIQGMNQRADVAIFGGDGKVVMLVECKAPSVEIDSSVYAQALRYNNVVGARYLLITNGLDHFVYERNSAGEYLILNDFPALN